MRAVWSTTVPFAFRNISAAFIFKFSGRCLGPYVVIFSVIYWSGSGLVPVKSGLGLLETSSLKTISILWLYLVELSCHTERKLKR